PAHGGGVGEGVEQAGDRGAHREHAVRDDTGQPGRGGDGVVVVDGGEVAGGAGVAHEGVAGDLVAGAGELVPDGQRGQVRGGGGGGAGGAGSAGVWGGGGGGGGGWCGAGEGAGGGCSWIGGVCGGGAGGGPSASAVEVSRRGRRACCAQRRPRHRPRRRGPRGW